MRAAEGVKLQSHFGITKHHKMWILYTLDESQSMVNDLAIVSLDFPSDAPTKKLATAITPREISDFREPTFGVTPNSNFECLNRTFPAEISVARSTSRGG